MSDATPTTAEAQLERVLYTLAAAKGDDGLPLDELAARLGVEPRRLYAELAQVRDREYYYPAGSAFGMLLLLERDRVSVPVPGEFRRPTRLTVREAVALALALRARAAEAPAERRAELLALAEALDAALTPAPRSGRRGHGRGERESSPAPQHRTAGRAGQDPARPLLGRAVALDPGEGADRGMRLLMERAIAARSPVRIRYLKPTDVAPAERVVHPYALAFAEGVCYLVGRSLERAAVRVFRLGRILDAAVLEGSFEVPATFDPADFTQGARPYRAEQEIEVAVRYSARVAPWILEASGPGDAQPCEDGSVIVRHRVADRRWLVREVLRHAGDAVVLEPPELGEAVVTAAETVLAGMGGTGSAATAQAGEV